MLHGLHGLRGLHRLSRCPRFWRFRWVWWPLRASVLCAGLVGLALPLHANPAAVRAQEITTCLPGEIATWPDGRDRPAPLGDVRLVYRHDGAPARFSAQLVRAALQAAAQAWSACEVPARLLEESDPDAAGAIVVQWNDAATRGNFALADLRQRQLSLSAAMFVLLARRNPRHPAHETLQMAVSHEMGHFFGLMAHSRRCVDVMSYYVDAQGARCRTRDGGPYQALPEYRALLPTACDIARCRAANGLGR